MTVRDRTAAIVDGRPFQRVIIGVIAVNAIALGCETSPALVEAHGGVLTALDRAALAVFTAELAARLYAHRLRFFRDPWNCFDLVVVGLALLPAAGPLSIVRSLRVLRALRLVAMVPSMRRVVTALVRSIPGLLSLSGLLLLLLYVGGVVAINLFRGSGDARFEDLGATVLTLFQITTGDSWSDVMRDVMDEQPLAWVFFVCYLLVGTFTMLNLFIAVVCSAMESEVHDRPPAADPAVLGELRALREEVRALAAERAPSVGPAERLHPVGSAERGASN
ncbi:ion transporter [Saccharothrix algeriensis]|uniref:Ion transporter n=1 Tax=Saccharothrix algeriensis TaxID=173560 RepID=A0A8T8HYF4_9PSEU|nr:ion transporter [Saccharothrix algeriensis]MBM7815239.1 voltage-gated sodium channel [Saccharothrix algeriensis]QTR03468.1 ion transporter [Saccharothrix algeriensis]